MNPVNINFERPQFSKEDSARNMEVVNRWISDSAEKLNMLVSILQNEETHADATGDSIGEATMNFTSSDVEDGSATAWTSVPALKSGEKHNVILGKVSQMFKNVRYLFKMLGTTDISGIGDGTATGAISALNADLAKQWEKIYPVGSIYISANSTSPANFFGGTWEQISGRFLIGTGDIDANTTDYWGHEDAHHYNIPAGELGGESSHTLTVNEMPSHAHAERLGDASTPQNANILRQIVNGGVNSGANIRVEWKSTGLGNDITTTSTGGSAAHNNMPPYLSVYMWKRTA